MGSRLLVALSLSGLALGCVDDSPAELDPPRRAAEARDVGEAILPIPTELELDRRTVDLGRRLFADPILSKGRDTTCLTCHPFANGGADGAARSQLPGREMLAVNTPTVFNSSFNYRLHWNGRFTSLEDQLDVPLTSPKVMASTYEEVLRRLRDSSYAADFSAIWRDGVTERNFRVAIATYERSLITPRSRFDRFLEGDATAISQTEREGFELFKSYGCISCHQGVNVGGNLMQRFGVLRDYFAGRAPSEADLGLYLVTKREEDKHVFRVASLRNVARTGPYFHDGSVTSLSEAVKIMAEFQLGRRLSEEHTKRIVAFLETLTGDAEGLL
jgi:cytochrome c peroxidase